jgi:hypothetical protein
MKTYLALLVLFIGGTNERILLGCRRYKRRKLMSGFFWVGGGTKGGN